MYSMRGKLGQPERVYDCLLLRKVGKLFMTLQRLDTRKTVKSYAYEGRKKILYLKALSLLILTFRHVCRALSSRRYQS